MNEHSSFERLVAESVASIGVPAASDEAIERTIVRASRKRQRPRWLALIKEPPMRISSSLAVGSPIARVAAIMVATLLLALMVAAAGAAGSRLLAASGPIIVDQSGAGTVTTITDAVAMAQDGDEILVKPGTYKESVTISNDIILRGEDRSRVIIRPTGDTATYDDFWWGPGQYSLLLVDSNAEISDLSILGTSYDFVIQGGAPSIHDITKDGSNFVVYKGSSATVKDSRLGGWVHVDEQSPITIEGSSFRAIVANVSNTELVGGPATIRNNTTEGIAFNGSALVEGNTIVVGGDSATDDFYGSGIDVEAGDGWIIQGNTVTGFSRATAIDVPSGTLGTVSGNTLSDDKIAIQNASDSLFENNVITGGETGIATSLGSPTLTGNTISGVSGNGLALDGQPTLSGNTSCDNGENLWVAEGATPLIDDSNEICEDAPAE